MSRGNTDPRSGRRYRAIRAEFKARARAQRLGCWLYPLGQCALDGAPIDYDTPTRTPASFELHHKRPAATHPWLVLEPSNFAAGHAKCNQVLGKRSPLIKVQMADNMQSVDGALHKNAAPCIERWSPAAW